MLLHLYTAAALLFLVGIHPTHCWQQWNYSSYSTDEWRLTWSLADGPNARRGHSLVLLNETKLILFGGRGNDAHRVHVPRRFEVIEDEGVLEFATNEVPLSSRYSPESCSPIKECTPLTNNDTLDDQDEMCTYSWHNLLQDNPNPEDVEEVCGFVPVGTYYNDLWTYDVDCLRYADLACVDDGWKILHPGITFGGPGIIPSERYGHGAAMLNETTMAIYGGYSQGCEDYCDDLWMFDLVALKWSKQETAEGPGERWKFSMVADSSSNIYIFGGHRLWHGFSSDNNFENRWENSELLPKGGYLDDLWMYSNGSWTNVEGQETCVHAPGLTWESRNDQRCDLIWPGARFGHAAVYDASRDGIWIHGGYSTYFPYPTNKDTGSNFGVDKLGTNHISATSPTYQFYLDDLWFYSINSGLWEKKRIFGSKPRRRQDHVLALAGNTLILHGGYGDNYIYNDTWHYSIDENRWLEKENFVHADYPDTCTDDVAAIENDPSCIELEFPDDLRRSNDTTLALKYQDILPFSQQEGYTPDPKHPLYFGIVNDAEAFVDTLREKYLNRGLDLESTLPDGTAIAPKAATGPNQYARQQIVTYNETTDLAIFEWCTSVQGEPTRGKPTNNSVFIPQPRRQSPGWDGCRDFRWKMPPSRSDHASIFVAKHDMLVVYGGLGYGENETLRTVPITDKSPATNVLDDLWVLEMHSCSSNCSKNGVCTNGFCKCDPGFYGIDCSNTTCPGSVCHYDDNNVQHCTHCCYDSAEGIKVPCQFDDEENIFTGSSEGICDGFGTCQCAPPYIGEDCSILDCTHNCSFNGYCSIEFPQSRCKCKDGFTGEFCQWRECNHNCSYPNGICSRGTGECSCNALYSPYDRRIPWDTWKGDDCSYLPAWSGQKSISVLQSLLFVVFLHSSTK
ncbi:kelch repeat-containing protein [Skeletonema marinoi]|uniref:Kelch repeat-containing protein n=1 Tax=Skeletonema marinoi TaxID=267567 RepID=A0AAD8YCB4_9STRA|nr:kelch repeat-containing protein [Skeletonema marinoi]